MIKYYNHNRGFTLFELLVVTVIIGIVGAISAPSFFGFLNRAKVNKALTILRSTITITQQEAIKKSQTCSLNLPNNDTINPIFESSCLTTGKRSLDDVMIKYNNISNKKINFNFRGHTSPLRTIVIYHPKTNYKRCIVISNGIGMVRTGVYTNNNLSSISASYCQTSP